MTWSFKNEKHKCFCASRLVHDKYLQLSSGANQWLQGRIAPIIALM